MYASFFYKRIEFYAIFLAIFIDQASKYLIRNFICHDGNYAIGNYLNFVQVWNSGVSFGIGGSLHYSNYIFIGITSAIVVMMLCTDVLKKNKISFVLIVGGAIGNVVDRLIFGAVYDFIDFHIDDVHWPAFNIADSLIFIGVLIFFIFEYEMEKRD